MLLEKKSILQVGMIENNGRAIYFIEEITGYINIH